MKIETAISSAIAELEKAVVPDARRDAKTMLAALVGCDLAFIVAHPEYSLSAEEEKSFLDAVARRAKREPLQYILGRQEFYELDLIVTPDVLIPRPETEILVEEAIGLLGKYDDPYFCEVGIGSGCIAVAILANISSAKAIGVDVSASAIEIAAQNAVRHGVRERLELIQSDIFESLRDEKFDAIVSNPPYVPEKHLLSLQREVRDFEPAIALTAGPDGLLVIEKLIRKSPGFLRPQGFLLMEIGWDQSVRVKGMFDPEIWTSVVFHQDLQGIDRIVVARLN
jgi:release factor glutamine methyltransferase